MKRPLQMWKTALVLAVLFVLLASSVGVHAAPVTITPAGVWNDTSGTLIQAHGGGMIKVGSTYYWVGEDRANVTAIPAWTAGVYTPPFRNIKCYSSTDLVNWTLVGNLLTLQSSGDLGPDRVVERPKVIYNATTNKYVLWLHIDSPQYDEAKVGVASSNSVCSGYTYHGSFKPLGQESRDLTLYQDTDGSAYVIFSSSGNSVLRIAKLTADYLNADTQVATTPRSGEAPAVFKKDGTYFLVASAATGWDSNDNYYFTATSMAGPWTDRGDFTPNSTNTYDSQTTYILPVQGSQSTTYMYMGDRWDDSSTTSFGNSRYIWLPLDVSGTAISMNNYASWSIDTVTGAWSSGAGTQLFYDDFEDGNANGWTTNGGTWEVYQPAGQSKEYRKTSTGDNVALAGTSSWTNYYVQAYINLVDENGGVCLLGRVQNNGQFYQLELKKDGAGNKKWWIWKNNYGTWTQIAAGNYSFVANTYYLMRLDLNANTLTASVSTNWGASFQTLGSGTDTSYPSGNVGFRSWGSGGRFDVITVVSR